MTTVDERLSELATARTAARERSELAAEVRLSERIDRLLELRSVIGGRAELAAIMEESR